MSNRGCRDIQVDACLLPSNYAHASVLHSGRTMRFLVTRRFLLAGLLVSLIETSSAAVGFGCFEILPRKCIPRDAPVCKRAIAPAVSVSGETFRFSVSAELSHMPIVHTRTLPRMLGSSTVASMRQTSAASNRADRCTAHPKCERVTGIALAADYITPGARRRTLGINEICS